MLGVTLRWWDERLSLRAMAGLGGLVNLAPSHLWPVEPLFEAELAYAGRVDTFSVDGAWAIRENVYVAGLPERSIRAHVAWVRIPSWRRWRAVAEASYEYMRYTPMNLAAGVRRADRLQVLRARGRLFWTITGPWRLFGELAGSAGWLALDQPSCDAAGCPASGLFVRALIGVAYVHAERPRDERLLADVW
jgi:hypothetical protein